MTIVKAYYNLRLESRHLKPQHLPILTDLRVLLKDQQEDNNHYRIFVKRRTPLSLYLDPKRNVADHRLKL